MASIADMPNLYELADFLLNERGYLVVGNTYVEYRVGQIINKLWNVDVEQPLRVIAETNQQDWREQCHLASKRFPPRFKQEFYKDHGDASSDLEMAYYYRLITD